MTEQRDPLERVLDVAVYAPLGLAMSLREVLPKLAERGRQQMESQVHLARIVGELAVQQGRKRAEKVISPLGRQALEFVAQWGFRQPVAPTREQFSGGREDGGNGQRTDDSPSGSARAGALSREWPASSAPAAAAPAAGGELLPIPGYDSLSASQVVQRLEGLSPQELEAVRAYEQSGRARKTVLTRIFQLKSPT